LTHVIGIDPGKATGVAFYDLETCKPTSMFQTDGGVEGFTQAFGAGLGWENQYNNAFITSEKFTLRSSNKFVADLSGVEINGWLKGEALCVTFPEPIQHMTLTKLRENKDSYADSVITKMMKEAGFKIGAGHTRMGLSVAVWYAAMILKHRPTLELLSSRS
jgi:hypothetical protein